jgi:NADPH-dependent curcumin reductase
MCLCRLICLFRGDAAPLTLTMTDMAAPGVPEVLRDGRVTSTEAVVLEYKPGERASRDVFTVVRRRVPELAAGQVLIHHRVTSVDPYQLNHLRRNQQAGEVVQAGCVGLVVASRDPRVGVGAQVATYSGWTEYATWTLADTEIADPALGDELDWIHVLGTPGVTAYVGMHDVGAVRAGWTVAVSAAAGAIGGVAVQLAKAAGARVIAIAGGAQRVAHTIDVLGADVGLDYRAPDFTDQLRTYAGDGIDLFFDNVGGSVLATVLPLLSPRGHAVIAGTVRSYETNHGLAFSPGDPNYVRDRIRSFHVGDYYATRLLPIRAELSRLLKSGQVTNVVTEFAGLASAPEAFESVFVTGSPYVGKRVVRIW